MRFSDLRFKPHGDKQPGHWQALHKFPDGRIISITRWTIPNRYHAGDTERPYEVMFCQEYVREYQTASDIDQLLATIDADCKTGPRPA